MDTTNDTLHADLLVIGFGKGGKAVAKTMGRLGKRVVLVEQSERMYGGTGARCRIGSRFLAPCS
ncbi:hypothetical protein AB0M44_34215 [Streptosporangium subroseum]|uniref:hypothetical protein n=1 Tax=Streptosporangium subroseum TaxID=106412 RepID=UPI003422B0BA